MERLLNKRLSVSLFFPFSITNHLPDLCVLISPYIVVSPLHTCKHTIESLCLRQPLMPYPHFASSSALPTQVQPTLVRAQKTNRLASLSPPDLRQSCPKGVPLWYVFFFLRIVHFVLFCVFWHRWSPSISCSRRVGLQGPVGPAIG